MAIKENAAASPGNTNGRLEGLVAIVTGAAGGIGQAVVEKMVTEGAAVIALDSSILPYGDVPFDGRIVSYQCDLLERAAIESAVRLGASQLGQIDILVNVAGRNGSTRAGATTEDEWNSVINVDLRACWYTFQAALPFLERSAFASMVNISSVHAAATSGASFPYGAAKAAVEGLTRSIAIDYGPSGIRANAVAPGWTLTTPAIAWIDSRPDPALTRAELLLLHPLRRLVEPEEVASAVAFLASRDASGITGTVITVDCGLTSQLPAPPMR